MQKNIIIIIPLFKDWESFELLIASIKDIFSIRWEEVQIIIVDDFSLQTLPKYLNAYQPNIKVIELNRNLGHQKVISVGLSYAVDKYKDAGFFVIMDADGEDEPKDIIKLLDIAEQGEKISAFAKRQKRSETNLFKIFYIIYKGLFKMLTGQEISFGNFCVLTNHAANRIINVPEIWLHFSSAALKSKLPFRLVPSERGRRLTGESKMNFTSLVNHGLSSIAVYSDIVAVRITIISFIFSILAVCIIITLFCIKFFTSLAIPGWTSYMLLGLIILITQFFSLGILLSFIILSSRTLKNVIPSKIFNDYIFKVHNEA